MNFSKSKSNNIRNRSLTVLLLLLLGMAFSVTAATNREFEEERWFQVELIIFAHNNQGALDSEDWPEITGVAIPGELVELSNPAPKPVEKKAQATAAQEPALVFEPVPPGSGEMAPGVDKIRSKPVSMPVAFEMLPEEELQLTETYKKMMRSTAYAPLLHVAWRQPTYEREKVQTVLLYEGMTQPAPESTADGKKTQPSHEDDEIGPENPRVIGTVSLSVERYLHLAADLVYRTPVTERLAVSLPDLKLWYDKPYPTLSRHQGPAYQLEQWNVIHGFRLKESRRMRSRKIHYLDHPFFGVVVLVTPVELPQDEDPDRTSNLLRNISSQTN